LITKLNVENLHSIILYIETYYSSFQNENEKAMFEKIKECEKCLNDIEVIAKNALKRGNAKLFEELRDNIFEFINEDVNTKLHSIKDILNDK
jgi:hypothetical protein